MRTTKFKQVFDRVVRWYGRDPRKEVAPDMREAVVDHINERVATIWQGWRWPEFELTEERAFRPIWNEDETYLAESIIDGQPDEVFYLGDGYETGGDFGDNYGYYRVIQIPDTEGPTPGITPGDAPEFWEALDTVETFIPYDQRDRRAIGMVLGIYSGNPATTGGHACASLRYSPSQKGISVHCTGVPTVFVTHKLPCPQYAMIPYVSGRTYVRSDVVFNPDDGECYQAFRTTTSVPTITSNWNWVPFLSTWYDYVHNGAFSDSCLEIDQAGMQDVQAKMILAQAAEVRANDALQAAVDEQVTQGQTLQYNFCRRQTGCCESASWSGGLVTLISQ